MSHWMQGKIKDLHCSIDKMREAIANVMPEWENFIDISRDGNITVRNYYTNESKSGFHIKVPKNKSIGINYADFGMKQEKDDTWGIEYDSGGLPSKMKNPQDVLKNEVAAMAMKELASIENLNMIEDSRGNTRRQVIRMSPEEAMNFLEN